MAGLVGVGIVRSNVLILPGDDHEINSGLFYTFKIKHSHMGYFYLISVVQFDGRIFAMVRKQMRFE